MLLFCIAVAADDTVCRALLFDFDHRPLAWAVRLVEPLGDDAVERAAAALQPFESGGAINRRRREDQARNAVLGKEALKSLPALAEPRIDHRLAREREQVEG